MNASTAYNESERTWSGPLYAGYDPTISLGQILINALQLYDDEIVVQINHDTGYRMTAKEMRLKSLRIAENLTALGIRQGDNVQLIVAEHDDVVPLCIGIMAMGATFNPLHIDFGVHEISHFVTLVAPKMLICEESLLPKVRQSLYDTGHKAIVCPFAVVADEPELLSVVNLTNGYKNASFILPDLGDLEEVTAFIMCSSGTTGTPKAVLVSHAMALYGLTQWWSCPEGTIFYCTSSLYWVTALGGIFVIILSRAIRVISAQPPHEDGLLELIDRQKVTLFYTSPPIVCLLLKRLEHSPRYMETLQAVQVTGCQISDRVKRGIRTFYDGVFAAFYGMSDISCAIAVTVSDTPNSIGQLLPGIVAKIIGDDGLDKEPLETGEVWLKTPTKILGYLNNAEANATAFDDNDWFHTGDIGYFDLAGHLYLVDRKKDMIKYHNYQIAPSELENYITQHIDVSAVVVIGIPDEEAGDLPAAVIVRSATNCNVTDAVFLQLIKDGFSDPKHLRGGVHFVAKLPQTVSGKVQRHLVRAIAMDWYEQKLKQKAAVMVYNNNTEMYRNTL